MSESIEYTTTITPVRTSTFVNGKLHSINDKPAELWSNGSQFWYINGKKHRDNDLPAEIWADGDQHWYIDDKRHRGDDKPAVIMENGSQYWFINGKLHRDNDQPAKIYTCGDKCWYSDDKLHRDGGKPAIVRINGDQSWYINGEERPEIPFVINPIAPITNDQQDDQCSISVNTVVRETSVDSTTFMTNKYHVDYCNMKGMVTQNITISDSYPQSVTYELSLDGDDTIHKYTIGIKTKDLNNITKMRVLKDNGWSISAMVDDTWITGVIC